MKYGCIARMPKRAGIYRRRHVLPLARSLVTSSFSRDKIRGFLRKRRRSARCRQSKLEHALSTIWRISIARIVFAILFIRLVRWRARAFFTKQSDGSASQLWRLKVMLTKGNLPFGTCDPVSAKCIPFISNTQCIISSLTS